MVVAVCLLGAFEMKGVQGVVVHRVMRTLPSSLGLLLFVVVPSSLTHVMCLFDYSPWQLDLPLLSSRVSFS